MTTLRIQHPVAEFEVWKRAFDADPADRKGGGVRHYSIHRPIADPKFVMIDLEFDSVAEADAFLEKLKRLWSGPAQRIMQQAQAWIVETIESRDVSRA